MPPTEKHHGDRGPKPYFHGRNEIIDVFKAVLHANKPSKTGTTFLVHGAPGAGKTALLAELCKVANRWKHARISLTALHDPIAMAQALGQAYAVDQKASLEAGIIYVKGGIVETIAGHATPTEILKCIATKHGLILVLDEAQRLSSLEVGSQEHVRVGDTLSMIHNGHLEMPVMLLAGGLSTTLDAFASFGITRFTRQCKPSLGGLHPHETKSVIRKFLSHEKVVPPLPKWIDAVAKQTHGWPQHIIAYASLLANHLSSINPDMSDTGLDSVLRAAREEQIAYYQERFRGIFPGERHAMAKLFAEKPIGTDMDPEWIIDGLSESYPEEKATALFTRALDRGIIDIQGDGYCRIPIPSLRSFLIDTYGREQDIP